MENEYLAFDIETAKILPADLSDWKSHRPLGISCAATLLSDSQELALWAGKEQMTKKECAELVHYLQTKVEQGYTILTWNGLGFDFDVLAEESGLKAECSQLAVSHIDMMFHVLCKLGFGVSLDAAAHGMGLAGKTMNGADAPKLWAEDKRHQVLEYVTQDVRTTLDVALTCEKCKKLNWIAKSGNLRTMKLPNGWLTVDKAEKLPLPNTAWMSEPWSRSDFTEWMGRCST
jgi:hypothetical protein